jgi:hypothetical protein
MIKFDRRRIKNSQIYRPKSCERHKNDRLRQKGSLLRDVQHSRRKRDSERRHRSRLNK